MEYEEPVSNDIRVSLCKDNEVAGALELESMADEYSSSQNF